MTYVSGMSYETFVRDTKTQDAVIRNIEGNEVPILFDGKLLIKADRVEAPGPASAQPPGR
jgi:hypothetical protein